MSKKQSHKQNISSVVLLDRNQQESFNKVCNVRKMMKLYPEMSLRSACAHNGCDYKTYKKYLDFVVKVEGLL